MTTIDHVTTRLRGRASSAGLTLRLGADELRIEPGDVATIGRHRQSSIRTNHERVSRFHGLVRFEGDAWWYVDTSSMNGSYVDAVHVGRVQIRERVRVRLGQSSGGPELELIPTS